MEDLFDEKLLEAIRLAEALQDGQSEEKESEGKKTEVKQETENSRPPPALARNLQEKPRRQPGTGTGARKATSVFKSRPCTFHVHIESESSPRWLCCAWHRIRRPPARPRKARKRRKSPAISLRSPSRLPD